MDTKTMEFGKFVDETAKIAHEAIDRMCTRAAKVEEAVNERVKAKAEGMASGIESRAAAFTDYIDKNPFAAAMMAFGVGYWASRAFGSKGPPVSKGSGVSVEKPTPIVGRKRARKSTASVVKKAA